MFGLPFSLSINGSEMVGQHGVRILTLRATLCHRTQAKNFPKFLKHFRLAPFYLKIFDFAKIKRSRLSMFWLLHLCSLKLRCILLQSQTRIEGWKIVKAVSEEKTVLSEQPFLLKQWKPTTNEEMQRKYSKLVMFRIKFSFFTMEMSQCNNENETLKKNNWNARKYIFYV